MPQANRARRVRKIAASKTRVKTDTEPRYSVGLPSDVAKQVARYAESVDISMSKAIATLVRVGVEAQQQRKRDFFSKLRANLANDDPKRQDRMIDEFRNIILGH